MEEAFEEIIPELGNTLFRYDRLDPFNLGKSGFLQTAFVSRSIEESYCSCCNDIAVLTREFDLKVFAILWRDFLEN